MFKAGIERILLRKNDIHYISNGNRFDLIRMRTRNVYQNQMKAENVFLVLILIYWMLIEMCKCKQSVRYENVGKNSRNKNKE